MCIRDSTEIAKQNTLDDSGIEVVITKQAQQRKDSIEAYITAERHDLVDKETQELNILSSYLPEQMSDDEVKEIVKGVIRDVGAKDISDMGKVMGWLQPRIQGRADMGSVSSAVKQRLSA